MRDGYAVGALLDRTRPDVVVHTAYRRDDWATTAAGAAHVALATAQRGIRLVHVSTDLVFADSPDPRVETDPRSATGDYGRAKAAAEEAVEGCHDDAVVVRTSLVLGSSGGRPSPMERLVHDLASGPREGVLFTDDVKCAVHVDDLAAALVELAASDLTGVLHCAGADALSRYDLGLLVARRDGLDPQRLRAGTRAATGEGPSRVLLDSSRAAQVLRTRLRGAREFLTT